ncbi:MAG TPA: TIGR03560 family F420-dependent LLM class oxidoreductase [Thermomicrobiales bacterium]|nr:TIGR03560 family F420-dependent LLM class oxidoreductase [Thermomicrobiales bacterium]
MAKLGIMIEGQEGLTWERWNRLIDAGERLGFDSIWRSDHLFSVMGVSERDTLALWPSLTAVATRSSTLEFGQLVSPVTYRHPVHLAFDAVSLHELSGGRFWLGVGAGWNVAEHAAFGFRLPPLKERMDRFEESLRVITGLWSGEPVTFQGEHFQLDGAQHRPAPGNGERVPIMIGGGGEKRTLRVVAEYADEWNVTTISRENYDAKVDVLKRHCEAVGRDFGAIRRSLMTGHIIGRTRQEIERRAERIQQVIPTVRDMSPGDAADQFRDRGWLVGTPVEIVEEIKAREAQGLQRFMLQTHDQDDIEALELWAAEVMPHIA